MSTYFIVYKTLYNPFLFLKLFIKVRRKDYYPHLKMEKQVQRVYFVQGYMLIKDGATIRTYILKYIMHYLQEVKLQRIIFSVSHGFGFVLLEY